MLNFAEVVWDLSGRNRAVLLTPPWKKQCFRIWSGNFDFLTCSQVWTRSSSELSVWATFCSSCLDPWNVCPFFHPSCAVSCSFCLYLLTAAWQRAASDEHQRFFSVNGWLLVSWLGIDTKLLWIYFFALGRNPKLNLHIIGTPKLFDVLFGTPDIQMFTSLRQYAQGKHLRCPILDTPIVLIFCSTSDPLYQGFLHLNSL